MSRNRGHNPNRLAALERDGWRCVLCNSVRRLEVHHVKSLKDGGTHELGNLQTLCRACHFLVEAARRKRPVSQRWRNLIHAPV